MVFFVVACQIPDADESAAENALMQCTGQGPKGLGEVYNAVVDKTKFKIGTLDSLMELNETLSKVDLTLDSTVKKIEKQAKEIVNQDLKIEVGTNKIDVIEYIQNFKWEDNKYSRARSLIEISGMITEKMRTIDADIKKVQDDLNETRNVYNSVSKKEGSNFMTKDLGDIIYHSNQNAEDFVEKLGSEQLSTLIAIVNKKNYMNFMNAYESIVQMAAVPRSAKLLSGLEDKEGNQLIRIVVLSTKRDEYITEAKKQGFLVKAFTYDYDKFKAEQENKTKLESKLELLKTSLSSRCYFAFSELFIALMHLKIMRAYIDGVLRFGIPPRFYIGIVRPGKGKEKQLLGAMTKSFAEEQLKEMYGSKEDGGAEEDFFPFVLIQLTSPMFLQ